MNLKRFAPALLPLLALACSGGDSARMTEEDAGSAAPSVALETAPVQAPAAASRESPAARSAEGYAQGTDQGTAATADTASGAAQPNAQQAAPSMIIRTGTAVVEVDSLEPAIEQVRRLAQQLGGYVGNTTITAGDRESRRADLELKIPSARFDQALAGIRPVGEVESVQVTAQDVGEEFVDVSARMANARRLEERLVSLLATRTGRLEDVLTVERELARVREEIERYEGRLRYLRTRVAVSTLTVTLHEPQAVVGDYPGQNPILEAFGKAWRIFVGFIAALIASLGFLVPLALIIAAIVWAVRKLKLFDRGRRPPPPYTGPYQGPPPPPPPAPGPPPPPPSADAR
ncbi:MAG TPA: DUF4349 domain-containing protein [Longimicrobium sp.]|jgi:hypothetical protein